MLLTNCLFIFVLSSQVTFKVNKGATSPLTFVASVWKDGLELQTAAPVQVTLTSKST